MNQNPEIMFHLVGEQAIPIFLAVIQFPKKVRHYLLTTESEKTKKTVANLKETLKSKGFHAEIHILGNEKNATSFDVMKKQIEEAYKKCNPEGLSCSFNITGGTKPMSISAVLASSTLKPKPSLFYLNFYSREILWLDGKADPLTERMKLADFVLLAGLQLKTPEKITVEPSKKFLNFLADNAYHFQRCQVDFANYVQKKDDEYFTAGFKKLEESLQKKKKLAEWQSFWKQYLDSAGEKGISKVAQASFLGGIWLEYYVYKKLKNVSGITEILHSAELMDNENAVRQEIDVAYTDGFSLVIIECKAGKIIQDHIQKLENLRNVYSGAMSSGGIVCINKSQMSKIISSRIIDSKNIAAFSIKIGLENLKSNLFNFKTGHIYAE